MAQIHEKCFLCIHWDFTAEKCKRIVKIKMFIGQGGGDLDIQTQPGLIPEYLEAELNQWLVDAITTAVDSWPGWGEIANFVKDSEDRKECAARENRTEGAPFLKVVKFDG